MAAPTLDFSSIYLRSRGMCGDSCCKDTNYLSFICICHPLLVNLHQKKNDNGR